MDSDARRHASEGGLNTNLDLTNNMLIQHSAGYTLDAQQLDGIHRFHYCVDACDEGDLKDGGELLTRGSWHQLADEEASCGSYLHNNGRSNITESDNLDILEAGTFVFKYTCKDSSNNWATPKCTTIINQDHSKPIVNAIEGINSICADLQLEGTCYYASATAPPYDDAGAICSDMVDGDISELVTVSGDVVDLAKVDTYHITYDCVDTTGNDAEQAFRDVFVVDRTCPTCTIPKDDDGKSKHYLVEEASVPYSDDPVFCTDDMPFNLHGEDFTNNGPCVYSKANPGAVTNAPCTAIAGSSDEKAFIPLYAPVTGPIVDVERVGTYYITYTATDSAGNTNFNYLYTAPGGESGCNSEKHQIRTVVVKDTLVPIITLQESLMEETHDSVNAWVIGALGSAVAGVALLGYATHKASATMVPV
jgi:rubredoxin